MNNRHSAITITTLVCTLVLVHESPAASAISRCLHLNRRQFLPDAFDKRGPFKLNLERTLCPEWDQARPNITGTVDTMSLQLLTGFCGASLSILKTCATFPLALRCILKPGMAQRVARLIMLHSEEAK